MSVADSPNTEKVAAELAALFPLPVTTFEYFMFADTRPEYPMMCDLELHFEGRIDRRAFDAGLTFGLKRNPLFRALIDTSGPGPLAWKLTDHRPEVDWAPVGTPLGTAYDAYVDLRSEIGLRIWVRESEERSTVLLHFHHACADGLGGYAFIEDFLAGYAAAFPEGPAVTPRQLEPERLRHREDFGPDTRGRYRRLADSLIGLRESIRFFAESPRPLAVQTLPPLAAQSSSPLAPATASAAADPSPACGFTSLPLSEQLAAGLRRVATENNATVNDVMLRDLFLTLRTWNRQAGEDPGRRRLRILMPQSLRNRDDRGLPAANKLSFAFATRRGNQCDPPQKLLESISRETELVRKHRLSLYFLGSLASARGFGFLDWVLGRPICFTTVVLTNLGDPSRRFATRFPRARGGLVVGNLVFHAISGGPPLRPLTRGAFSIFNGPRSMSLSLKCDPRWFSQLDSRRLLDEYVAQLHLTAQAAKQSGGSRSEQGQ
jgi:hypothetical protein